MSLNALGKVAWEIAEQSGWHDQPHASREDAAIIRLALIMSEAAEAIEWVRKGDWAKFEIELSDIIIRTVELGYIEDCDLDDATQAKMAYNQIRLDVPTRAGGKSV